MSGRSLEGVRTASGVLFWLFSEVKPCRELAEAFPAVGATTPGPMDLPNSLAIGRHHLTQGCPLVLHYRLESRVWMGIDLSELGQRARIDGIVSSLVLLVLRRGGRTSRALAIRR
jgi:hypothetical protein